MSVAFDADRFAKYGNKVLKLAAAYFAYGHSAPVVKSTKSSYPVGSKSIEFVDQSPAELAKAAGVDVETYSLARVIVSEGYGTSKDPVGTWFGAPIAAIAIGQAVRNKARMTWGGNITKALTNSKYANADASLPQWHYGEQSGRYAATRADPNRWHIEVARAVLNNDVPDFVGDAFMFFAPKTQDGGSQMGRAINNAADTLTGWSKSVAYIGPVYGVDPYYLMFLHNEKDANKRAAALAAALDVVYRGRAGDHAIVDGSFSFFKLHAFAIVMTLSVIVGGSALGYLYGWPYAKKKWPKQTKRIAQRWRATKKSMKSLVGGKRKKQQLGGCHICGEGVVYDANGDIHHLTADGDDFDYDLDADHVAVDEDRFPFPLHDERRVGTTHRREARIKKKS